MFNYFQQSIKLIAGFIIVGFFLFCLNNFNFKMFSIVPVQAKVSSDAIAIRVIPNPEHYSALRWYKKQGFSGSPQSLIVDGYGAVRDGRTVYVNAANIAEDGNLYTNIYLILYNQEAGATTQDIFSRILSHWEFNTNISDPGQCNESDSIVCVIDFACPINEYCLSDKSEIIRDTKRLADLADMKDLLAQYKKENNRYPSIRAGSYLPNKTISAWPSWQSVLAQELKTVLSEDPINKLGDCGDDRFNPITCWDEQNKEFADTDLSDSAMNLPVGSEIYVYSSAKNGESYEVCAVMESGYVSGVGSGACDSSESINIDNKIANSQPIFKGINLPIGYSGEEYLGLIEASDPDGDILSWNIDTSANAWTAWSSAPAMSDTESLSQKKISALSAGVPGNYVFTITVNDNKGESNSSAERDFTINVINPPPVITANDITCTASTTNPLNYYGVTAQDYISNYPLAYGLSVSVPNNLTANFARSPGSDFYTFSLTGIFNPITESPIYPSKDYNFTITVTDVFGVSAIEDFKITVLNNRPVIHTPLNCDTVTRVNNLYDSCAVTAIDADGNAITYSFSGLPAGISGDSATGVISGTPAQTGDYTIVITVTDEYGAVSNQGIYDLKVNNYCGDGTVQSPNMENFFEECEAGETLDCVTSDNYDGRLSCIVDECIWDDICNPTESCGDGSVNGDEECDNADGTADNPADSYENNQYSCTTPPADTCEYTGGWCGDGIIQDGYGEECDPNETKIDYESRMGIVIDNATWIAVQAACNYCAMSCLDADGDGYGYPVNLNCLHFELDCDDRPNGEDGIPGTFDDGANINPGQPDDCTQYDGIDNNCDGKIDDSDHDNDEDGIGACSDNCPDIFNPEQEDADGDEIGDFCDDCYNYGGSCVELTITQGVWTKTFRPYVKADTSSEFYCYNGNCANPYTTYPTSSNLAEAYDFVESQRSNIFAYINANNNMLSLGFLHDYINDGSGGEVHFNFSGNGWDMSIVSVSDDNTNEFSKIIHGNWDWEECCTDGGMIDIANLNTSWSITITPDFISGINSWAMKAPGNEENIPNLTDPVIINYIAP